MQLLYSVLVWLMFDKDWLVFKENFKPELILLTTVKISLSLLDVL